MAVTIRHPAPKTGLFRAQFLRLAQRRADSGHHARSGNAERPEGWVHTHCIPPGGWHLCTLITGGKSSTYADPGMSHLLGNWLMPGEY